MATTQTAPPTLPALDAEWLETDGLGGFASGTVSGMRTRRYHAILTTARTPPTGRVLLVPGVDAWLEFADGGREFLTVQRYAPGVSSGSTDHLVRFTHTPWPAWTFQLRGGLVTQELTAWHGTPAVALQWRAAGLPPGTRLVVRPFLSGRDIHALHHENAIFRFDADVAAGRVRWQPYPDPPAVECSHDGDYRHDPVWYRNFQLDEERARGFDAVEDAGSPGEISWAIGTDGAASLVLAATALPADAIAAELGASIRNSEAVRRAALGGPLERAADQYLVRRGSGRTIVAGYPWFTDWGRDTFIAVRGLCLATGRLDEARAILLEWAGAVSEGMMPNRFVDDGDAPEFNSVDASLWYVIAVHDYLDRMRAAKKRIRGANRVALEGAVTAILEGYTAGTRYGIRRDDDGLLACGVAGQQLTWMDARIGDWVVTPRIGKPVEVQALWINALLIGARLDNKWGALANQALRSFRARFWNPDTEMLNDVVDVDHHVGAVDSSIRPNQIFAVGGLPVPLLEGARAAQVVAAVTSHLLTRIGLRSLAPRDPRYAPSYEGGPRERDGAYHQGTIWPWLFGPFVEAWLRVKGDTTRSRALARELFLVPLLAHLEEAGLGHVSEIADADPPFTPRGCPFQAWSVGEVLRIVAMTAPPKRPSATSTLPGAPVRPSSARW